MARMPSPETKAAEADPSHEKGEPFRGKSFGIDQRLLIFWASVRSKNMLCVVRQDIEKLEIYRLTLRQV